jgi:fructuronate reductase
MTSPGAGRHTRHPVRIVHLGLGAFHRAHQAWYTQRANDLGSEGWGIEAFTGRTPDAADALSAQDCVYSLIERGPLADSATLVESISAASDGADVARWRRAFEDPHLAIVTLTITEAGYRLDSTGTFDLADAQVVADLGALRAGEGAVTAPARLVDGLRARRAAGGGALAIVSCDNLPDNGGVIRTAVLAVAGEVDPALAEWVGHTVSFVSTMVDRITPATTPADVTEARALTGFPDAVPVVAEPFSEWVLSGGFPAGRPDWHRVGARFVDDIVPFEQRKLWLLNAGHSLLAYRGLRRGHTTVAEAMLDEDCRAEVEELWSEARPVLSFDDREIDDALDALRRRFGNARIEHRLLQVGTGGSQKLGPRIVDPIRRRLAAGLPAGRAQVAVIAAWAVHLGSVDRKDPATDELALSLSGASPEQAASAVLEFLAPDLRDDLLEPVTAGIRSLSVTEAEEVTATEGSTR